MHGNVYHACRSISFHEDYGFLNITDGIHVPSVHCTLPCIRKWYVHHSLTHRREWKIDETRARPYSSTFFFFFFFFLKQTLTNLDYAERIISYVCTYLFRFYVFKLNSTRRKCDSFIFKRIGQDSLHSVLDEVEVLCTRIRWNLKPWLMVPISFILLDELKNFFTRSFAITINFWSTISKMKRQS